MCFDSVRDFAMVLDQFRHACFFRQAKNAQSVHLGFLIHDHLEREIRTRDHTQSAVEFVIQRGKGIDLTIYQRKVLGFDCGIQKRGTLLVTI